MSPVIIHGVPGSPYVRKVLLACEEKGAPYRLAAMAFGAGKSPEHLAGQPFGRMPWIEHDGFWLYETDAIIRYVDEAAIAAAIEPSKVCIKAMEAILGDQTFMAGEQLSLADLMLLPHLDFFPMSPEGAAIIAGSPLLVWLERMRARPSAQATEAERLMAAA